MFKEKGFTLLELLVAVAMTSAVMAIATGQVIMLRKTYLEDVGRIKVQSNLTAASDIMGMNLRQAGENLPGSFPALHVTNGEDGEQDVLKIRRNLLPEVLTLCSDAYAGQNALYVSDDTVGEPQCLKSQVTYLYNTFENFRTSKGGTVSIYIYNIVEKRGEFVTYSSANSDDKYELTISPLENDYPAMGTSIYMLEEFSFQVDTDDKVLTLTINEDPNFTEQSVAFSINALQVAIYLKDGTALTEFNETSGSWKKIRNVVLTLGAEEKVGKKTIVSSLESNFFPRNILSRD